MQHIQPKRVELRGPVVDLLVDMKYRGFIVPVPSFPPVVGGDWDGFDLGEYEGKLVLADKLTLHLEVPPGELVGPLYRQMKVRNKPALVRLADGSSIEAELAHMTNLGDAAKIDLHHWFWTGPKDPAVLVGKLNGKIATSGNQSILYRNEQRRQYCAHDNYRLDGHYTWYLIHNEGDHYTALVEPAGKAIDRERLIGDILAMEFAAGGPIQLDYLIGLDNRRQCIGAISVEHLVRRGHKRRSPVPDTIGEAEIWIPLFFTALAKKVHDEGLDPLLIAVASYLDAESDHLDGGYLKAHVGLEAFATRLVGGGRPELVVKDEAAWKSWLDTLQPTMKDHLIDPQKLDVVFGKFVAAMFAPTGELVRRALADRGISLPKEVVTEIKKRNYPAHNFLMNSGLDHEIDRDVRRLEMMQTLIVALVSTHVGYGGPVKGYDVESDGSRACPSWWPTTKSAEDAAVHFVAVREAPVAK